MIISLNLNASIDKLYVVDEFTPNTVMRVQEVNNTAGGKGMNVARVAALAGEAVTAMGFVGGHCGEYFESLIDKSLIDCRFTRVEGETRSCINVRRRDDASSTEFLEPGAHVSDMDMIRFLQDYSRELERADVVTMSGSLPKGLPTEFYAVLVRTAKDMGKAVVLDSSGDYLRAGIRECPTLIKPNQDEIRQLLDVDIDSRQDLVHAACTLHDGGMQYVAVSLGKDGALLASDDGVLQGSLPPQPVVNTVGCGDSMVAGFACQMVHEASAEEMLRFAVAVSAANALTKGTGSFRREDLRMLLPQVRIDRVK